MNQKVIKIKSQNPYNFLYPDRKIVTLDTLNIIKEFRNDSYKVIVLPEDDRPVTYLFQKGLNEFFTQYPLYVFLLDLPASLAMGLLTNKVERILSNKREKKNTNGINIFLSEIKT